ncbi:Retrovirus-related Pol polyprotein from transposon 17.6, partial [Mucuna pruriens]
MAIGWKLSDLPGINPSICMNTILMEEEAHPIRQQQRRLNSTILDMVKKEVTKLLTVGIIYPISNSQWVSPVQVVPKKSGITVMKDQHDELHCMEVFMDDLTVYATSFDACLENLTKVLTRCIDTNLVLNFEKCHFMVTKGIVLGHLVSSRGIEVDKSKIDIITSLPNPAFVWEVCSFLGHVGFYRRFIKNFSKIALPLSKLLQKDVDFKFDRPSSKIIILSDLAALRFLLKKLDAKPRLIRSRPLSRIERASDPMPIQDDFSDEQLIFHQRHSGYTKRNLRVMQNTTYEIILIFGDFAMIKSFADIDFMGSFPISNGYSYILFIVNYVSRWVEVIATKTNDAKVVVDFLKSISSTGFVCRKLSLVTKGVTSVIEPCPLYSTSMGWCTELPQHITPRQTAKLKCLTWKSRKLYKRWLIPVGRTGADSLRTHSRHTRRHTRLRWGCLPTRLSSTKPATYRLNWNIELTG